MKFPALNRVMKIIMGDLISFIETFYYPWFMFSCGKRYWHESRRGTGRPQNLKLRLSRNSLEMGQDCG